MSWYLCIIQCRDKTLYTGTTKDLKRRIYDHNRDKACRYTKCRWPVRLIHSEKYSTKSEALKREAYIKGLNRAKKLSLASAQQ
ncbi:MAG: GIY-YIG nuclease family protein [Candidatus Ratteibacteria bacterium]|nr:GIY-YIG nuclease family protein [Candidatus Ratteibacteria bacterium]